MEKNSYTEPVFLISNVAEILNIHPQTLRQYEREGFIKPSRTNGKIRLYSQKDINHIKYVTDRCLELSKNNDVDFNILYVAAAYHDIGHHINPK